MNVYFDTEFTGLVPNTTLISIGCVTEYGNKFYAEFTDYNKDLCDDWINENVIKNLSLSYDYNDYHNSLLNDSSCYCCLGTTNYIRGCLNRWLTLINSNKERIQFVSDVCHYDFYLLVNQIFGGAFNLPECVNPVCYDICQDLDFGVETEAERMRWAFDVSREELCKSLTRKLPDGEKHNALYDAEVIKMIYEGLNKE